MPLNIITKLIGSGTSAYLDLSLALDKSNIDYRKAKYAVDLELKYINFIFIVVIKK